MLGPDQARSDEPRADSLGARRHRSRPRRLRFDREPTRSRRGGWARRHGRCPRGFGVSVLEDAAELSAGGGSGRAVRRHATAGGSLDQSNRGGRRAGGKRHPGHCGSRRRPVGGRVRFHRRICCVEPGFLRHSPETLRGSHRPLAGSRRDCRSASPETGGDPAGGRVSVQPAAHSRSREHGRIPICSGGFAESAAGRNRRDDARPAGRGEPAAGTRRRFLDLRRRHPAGPAGYRPQQGAGARRQDRRPLQRCAVDHRSLLYQ